ncbi:MAG: DUF3568 family protein [candidate division NC10 bacterium]|nr:DUF3568 family protein [candidate division NC10 bacterium]
MMSNRWKIRQAGMVILLLAALGLLAQGCALLYVGAGAGAGAGTVAYVKGELEHVYSARYERVWEVSLASLKQLGIKVLSSERDAISGTIKAARSDGTSVTVKVAPLNPQTTSVKIRVGTFGDKEVSEMIQNRVAANLKGSK